MRQGKECHFLKVSEDSSSTVQKRSKPIRSARARSLHESQDLQEPCRTPFDLPPEFEVAQQLQPLESDQRVWRMPRAQHSVFDTYPAQPPAEHTVETRPKLIHRLTDPRYYPRSRLDEFISHDERISPGSYHSPMLHNTHMQPPFPMYQTTAPWPIYAPYATDNSSSRASDRSSSFDGLPSLDHVAPLQTAWSPSPSFAAMPSPTYPQSDPMPAAYQSGMFSKPPSSYLPPPRAQSQSLKYRSPF